MRPLDDDAPVMIELLRALVLLLSLDTLTVKDVIARVGSVAHDPGVPMPIEIHPGPGLLTASLARYADTGLPYLLTLEPAPSHRPTVAALRLAFGDYRRARSDRGRPVEVLFHSLIATQHWKVVLIAEISTDGSELDEAKVISVALRRDPLSGGDMRLKQSEKSI